MVDASEIPHKSAPDDRAWRGSSAPSHASLHWLVPNRRGSASAIVGSICACLNAPVCGAERAPSLSTPLRFVHTNRGMRALTLAPPKICAIQAIALSTAGLSEAWSFSAGTIAEEMKGKSMRLISATALSLFALCCPNAQDASRTIAGGGISVPNWTGKIDSNEERQGHSINDDKFAKEGDTFKVTTGPAVSYWDPKNTASGNYTVSATFTEPKFMNLNTHPHPYGVF